MKIIRHYFSEYRHNNTIITSANVKIRVRYVTWIDYEQDVRKSNVDFNETSQGLAQRYLCTASLQKFLF